MKAFNSAGQPRRQINQPELEQAYSRSTTLGYEPPDEVGFIRCLSHGFPTPLARWHHHDEYELHLITSTSGKAFVGDWIGQFKPGHLVLTGPRLPHNWISMDMPEGGVAERDWVIQFLHEPIQEACNRMPEMRDLLLILEHSKHGIEFFDLHVQALAHWRQIKSAKGLRRLSAFFDLMAALAHSTDYRLLSSAQMQSTGSASELDHINTVVNQITDRLTESLSASQFATDLGMTESRFSRFFRRATGNTFTDFVNHVRINRACQFLMASDRPIGDIGYDVGFHNLANFNRRFLNIKGITPTEYRRQTASRFG